MRADQCREFVVSSVDKVKAEQHDGETNRKDNDWSKDICEVAAEVSHDICESQ